MAWQKEGTEYSEGTLGSDYKTSQENVRKLAESIKKRTIPLVYAHS